MRYNSQVRQYRTLVCTPSTYTYSKNTCIMVFPVDFLVSSSILEGMYQGVNSGPK